MITNVLPPFYDSQCILHLDTARLGFQGQINSKIKVVIRPVNH